MYQLVIRPDPWHGRLLSITKSKPLERRQGPDTWTWLGYVCGRRAVPRASKKLHSQG